MVVTRKKSELKKAAPASKQTVEELFADISACRTATATPIRNPYTKKATKKAKKASPILNP